MGEPKKLGERLQDGIYARDEIASFVNHTHTVLTSTLRGYGIPAFVKITVDSRLLGKEITVAGDCGPVEGYSSSKG